MSGVAPDRCGEPMRGFYGAETVCARPKNHIGAHDPIWRHTDWDPERSGVAPDPLALLLSDGDLAWRAYATSLLAQALARLDKDTA